MAEFSTEGLPFADLLKDCVKNFEEKSKEDKDKDRFFVDFFVDFLKQYKDLPRSEVIGFFLVEALVVNEKCVSLLQYLTFRDFPRSLLFILTTRINLSRVSYNNDYYDESIRFLMDCALEYGSIQCICFFLSSRIFYASESHLQKAQNVKFGKREPEARQMLRESMLLSNAVTEQRNDMIRILGEIEHTETAIKLTRRDYSACRELTLRQVDLYEEGAKCERILHQTEKNLEKSCSLLLSASV